MIKICYLDDDMFMRDVVQQVLTTHGYEVVCVSRELEFIKQNAIKIFDILIIDVNLASVDGIDFAKVYRSQGLKDYIIFYTSDPSEYNKSRVNAIPNSRLVDKQLGVGPLLEVLKEWKK